METVCKTQGRKLVGSITESEKLEIEHLFERRNGLVELMKSFGKEVDGGLYERVVTDLGEVSTKMNQWWTDKSTKYSWESGGEDSRWEIDFQTLEIFLTFK